MRKLSIVVVGVSAFTSVVWANSVTLNPDQDNILGESTTGAISNALGDIFVGGTSQTGPARRGVVRFDITSAGIPTGSTINSVTLRLWLAKTGDTSIRSISVHRATADWGEGSSYFNGGIGTSSTTNDATWIHEFYSSTFWTASGGDFNSSSGSANVGSAGSVDQWYTWSSAGMKSDVQAWIASPSTNYGWVLIGSAESTSQTARRFTSRESVDDAGAHFPELVIDYTPPPGFAGGKAKTRTTTQIAGLRLLGERDLDGDGVADLLLRDDSRHILLGGHQTRDGLVTWELALDHTSDDPLAIH